MLGMMRMTDLMLLSLTEEFQSTVGEFFSQLWSALKGFSFSDFLDIILVAFVVYGAIKLVRETRAVQLMKGVVILVIVYLLVTWFRMEAMSYILSQLFGVALIAVFVLFQPEIRHALESVGRKNITRLGIFSLRGDEQLRNIELVRNAIISVSRACAAMSAQKVGALIVFEKETLLGEIIKTGTGVNADVTEELVGNIFYKGAPLHDGAMIIRDGRICAAGCILPLTSNNSISSALGTRHRAALGVSEQCDAMAVVVSEETGAISIAYKGILMRSITSAQLRQKLTEYILGDAEKLYEQSFFDRLKGSLKGRRKK